MRKACPPTPLGALLQEVTREEAVDSAREYALLGAHWYARGLYTKEIKPGSQIRAAKLYRVQEGDFVYNRLFAWKGSFAVADSENNGCYVSNEFPCFHIDTERLVPWYLQWYFSREAAWNEALGLSHGATPTSRNRLKQKNLLRIRIPLPPLEEQRWIVAKIDQLAAKIDEAHDLRSVATDGVAAFLISGRAQVMTAALAEGTRPITEAAVLERGKFTHRPRNDPRFFGGQHPWIQIGEIESAEKYITASTDTLNDDGLAISKKFPKHTVLISIAATIGAVGILSFDCCVPDSIVGVTPRDGVDAEFIYYYLGFLRTNLEQVAPQSAQKNINLRILSALPFPNVPLKEQRRIVAYLDSLQAKIDHLKAIQEQTAAELDALLPSILDRAFKGEL